MEQRLIPIDEPGIMERLNAAAQAGNIEALYAVIREDACLLKRIDEVPFVDTPMHIAASSGHTDFAMEMVTLMPSYARKLNQDGLSPMHLALQNEKSNLVLCLIRHEKDLIRVKGRNGMTPLHAAAAQGNLLLLPKFLAACPQCIEDVTIQGETALHIALKKKETAAFEVLVGWLRRSIHKDARDFEDLILNWRDYRGNSALHIALSNHQDWAVRLLLESQLVDVNTKNMEDLTALDIAKQSNNREIMKMLSWRAKSLFSEVKPLNDRLRSKIPWFDTKRINMKREKQNISDDTRNALLVVFVLVATSNYDAALSPPGGLWQGQLNNNSTKPSLFDVGKSFSHIGGTPKTNTSSNFQSPIAPPPPPPPSTTTLALGTIIMDEFSFCGIWILNTLTLLTTFLLIIYVFPSGSRRLLLIPICLMLLCYALSMSVISPTRVWSICNAFVCNLLVVAIYTPYSFGFLNEMRARRFQREWGSSHIF